jgi:hypothetical protein
MKWFRREQSAELPSLTAEQTDVLRRFAIFEIRIEDVRTALKGLFEFDFQPARRTASSDFRVPEPGIPITRAHIEAALERRRLALIAPQDLMHWATFILLNDAYEIDESDQEFIADCLNELSVNPSALL